MNSFFGAQLRRDLVELIDRPQLLRHRAQSTGSQRLSSNSAGQAYDNLHFSEASAQRYLNLANVDA